MGYRELSRMEIVEVVRQWQAGVSQRGIARATGLARETVNKYLAAAGTLGLCANGPPPSEEQVVALVRLGWLVGAPRSSASTRAALAVSCAAFHHRKLNITDCPHACRRPILRLIGVSCCRIWVSPWVPCRIACRAGERT